MRHSLAWSLYLCHRHTRTYTHFVILSVGRSP
jgi:hypothetical protein